MGLSNNLISQFAKLNNNSNRSSGELVYGTTVMQGSKLFVNIDGSDTITPVVTTSDVKPGERVTVMIKDHSATIMGNITNPSAGTEEMGKVLDEYDTIIAKIGNFELVVADKVSTDQLDAKLAIIDSALIGKASIAELNAVKATIKDLDVSKLEADIANINQAIINKADIEDLDAIHADIDLLEADVANINTLIGGHLTMDNIQSLVLTSSKVTVDNAFIKDAMIDRISASKINSGIINTNNVTIQSKDGSMLLKGTLQQFKDSAGKVRIQIGKDAKGDFTFVLYGADGKGQIINQNGITSSAISDGLIVNSMVSDNANISGEKLDINSVVTEINNGTKTIKSSKIFLDEKNQTFDVAFNNLSTTVDEVDEKVTSQSTQLTVAQGKIQTLISNTTITKADGKTVSLKDDYSSFQQTVNGMSSKLGSLETTVANNKKTTDSQLSSFQQSLSGVRAEVSSVKSTTTTLTTKVDDAQNAANTANSKVDNLQIGGRNYLPNTDFSDSTNLKKWYGSNESVNSFVVYQDFGANLGKDSFIRGDYVLRNRYDIAKAISLGKTYAGFKPTEDVVLEKNAEYTISFYMYKSNNCGKCYMTIFPVLEDGTLGTKCGGTSSITEYTGAFERYEVTFTTNAETNKYSVRFYNYHKDTLTSGYSDVHIYHPMLVKGNKAMDWSISSDDLQEQIDTHTTEISSTKSQIASVETNLDKITSRVETVETTSIENFNNLLINSNIKNGTTGWRLNNLVYGTSVRNAVTSYRAPDRHVIMIGDLNDLTSKIRVMDSTKFPVFAGEKISMSFHAMTSDYVESLQVYLLFTDNTSPIETDNTYFSEYSYIKASGPWKKYTLTATAPANATRCFVRIRYVSKEKPTTAENNRGSLCSIMVNRGEKYPTWTANTEDNFKLHETRLSFAESKITDTAITNVVKNAQFVKDMNGNITTNKSNISKIQQTATSITSRVDTLDGKYTELKQTVDGIDITGLVTFSDLSTSGSTTINGANITTGYISGDRIKGGKITATKEINFEGGARIFGNEGEFESGLAISAGGFSFSGGTINYLSGNWYLVDAGNLQVSDGNISAGGNITAGGYIYGSGETRLGETYLWCPYGSAYRDNVRLNGHIIASDSGGTEYLLILKTDGNYASLRAHAGSFANDVGCTDVYAANKVYAAGVALTSDESLKTDIRYVDLDPQVLSEDGLMSPNVNITTQDMHSFIETMPMISYRMKQDIANDIDYTYYGFVAQDILYTKVGSELIENDTLKETEIVVDENGENIEVTTERDILRFSVNKFVSFICGALQEEIRQRKALERRLNNLMDTINK